MDYDNTTLGACDMIDAFKRTISVALVVIFLALPLAVIGCAEDEMHTRQEITIENKVVSEHTVVE